MPNLPLPRPEAVLQKLLPERAHHALGMAALAQHLAITRPVTG